jgi:hypothetical protein
MGVRDADIDVLAQYLDRAWVKGQRKEAMDLT